MSQALTLHVRKLTTTGLPAAGKVFIGYSGSDEQAILSAAHPRSIRSTQDS